MLRSLVTAALLVAAATLADAADGGRFFVMGDGTLALVNGHTDERARVRYRNDAGDYDRDALARIRRLFRSRGDGGERDISLRLIEVLSNLQRRARGRELILISGYRSPEYNEGLRSQGRQAAGGSLHTDGIAADVALPRDQLRRLWNEMRALGCCGVGLYEKDGFMHIDVGRPRFWEPKTSKVGENLSAENARLFARTEFDRYRRGEPMRVTLHALTTPPVAIARTARLVAAGRDDVAVDVTSPADDDPGARCVAVGRDDTLVVRGAMPTARGHLELGTCEPRRGRTPAIVQSNAVEID